jgi:hypothetical protein
VLAALLAVTMMLGMLLGTLGVGLEAVALAPAVAAAAGAGARAAVPVAALLRGPLPPLPLRWKAWSCRGMSNPCLNSMSR